MTLPWIESHVVEPVSDQNNEMHMFSSPVVSGTKHFYKALQNWWLVKPFNK